VSFVLKKLFTIFQAMQNGDWAVATAKPGASSHNAPFNSTNIPFACHQSNFFHVKGEQISKFNEFKLFLNSLLWIIGTVLDYPLLFANGDSDRCLTCTFVNRMSKVRLHITVLLYI